MRMIEIESNGYRLQLSEYLPEGEPLAVVQIAHGMEEHRGRYEPLADYLTSRGFAVITADMRGHGKSVSPDELGFFADRNGWQLLLSDQLAVRRYIEDSFPKLPVFLIAHSMGSIISRVLLKTESCRWDRVVLSGYPSFNPAAPFGILLTNLAQALRGPRFRSGLISRMATGAFNRKIKHPRTDCDWLSVNTDNVDAFIADPLCGFGFTVSAMRDLFTMVELMHGKDDCRGVHRKLPILLISGSCDPCAGGRKGRLDSYETLRGQGFSNLSVMTLPNMRHEIFNETERERVFETVAAFLLQ